MEFVWLAAGMAVGIVLCAVLARLIVRRWRLPWREALMYFGLMPYPDEARLERVAPAEPSARRRAQARARSDRPRDRTDAARRR